jgi:spermidine/putrescine transport system substrate-binding protein
MFDVFVKSMAHTALYLGYRDALEGDQFTLSAEQLKNIRDTLIEQKPNVTGYLGSPPQMKSSLTDGDSSLGLCWRFPIAQLQRDGHDWAEIAVPKQWAMTWFEVAVVSSESENKETAWSVVDTFINPEVIGEWLAGVGIASTNKNVADSLPGDTGAIIDIDPSRVENMVAYKTIDNEDAWISAWEEVKAA